MTTIAYRDGVMAADKLAVRQDIKISSCKVHYFDGGLIGFAGNFMDCLHFMDWFADKNAEKEPLSFTTYEGAADAPDVSAIIAYKDGRVEYWTHHCQPIPIIDPFIAIGSGAMAAMAAMHMGADALEAIRIASLVDNGTGPTVDMVCLDNLQTVAAE